MTDTKPTDLADLDRRFPLGAGIDPIDERDYDLADFTPEPDEAEMLFGSKTWRWDGQKLLDQRSEGACASFQFANSLNCLPRKRKIGNKLAFEIYDHVTANDKIPGTSKTGQSGSYSRDNAAEYKRRGLLEAYAYTRDIDVMVRYLLNEGPIGLSTDWLRSMDRPDPNDDYYARVDWNQGTRGRHSYCISDIHWPRTGQRYVVILNSWFDRYGYQGRARLSEEGLRSLIGRSINNQAVTVVDKAKKKKVA